MFVPFNYLKKHISPLQNHDLPMKKMPIFTRCPSSPGHPRRSAGQGTVFLGLSAVPEHGTLLRCGGWKSPNSPKERRGPEKVHMIQAPNHRSSG